MVDATYFMANQGRLLSVYITAGQFSDYTGAATLLDDLAKAQLILSDRAYDVCWSRDELEWNGIKTLHCGPEIPLFARPLRQAAIQLAQPYRVMFGA